MARAKKRIARWAVRQYQWLQQNTIKTIAGTSLATGGAILLFYAFSIGELPEFSLADLTGTLIAVFVTGLLAFTAIGIYSLLPGVAARLVLDKFYPETERVSPSIDVNKPGPPSPREWLIRSRFLEGTTALALQAWLTLVFWQSKNSRFAPPHDTEFEHALWAAWIALILLTVIDWRHLSSKKARYIRHTLLAIWMGAIAMIAVLIGAAYADPDHVWLTLPQPLTPDAPGFDWKRTVAATLKHIYWIGGSVALLPVAIILVKAIPGCFRKMDACCIAKGRKGMSEDFPRITALAKWAQSKKEAIKLVCAKVCITAVFTLFLSVSLVFSMTLAGMGHNSIWLLNFLSIFGFQALLNWISFSVRPWIYRVLLIPFTAAVFLIFFPLALQNPAYFPKAIVATLGLGNIHLQSVSLAGGQCATLAPYGIPCSRDGNPNLTLTNVNLLNKVGASMVLELMIRPDPITPPADAPEKENPSSTGHGTRTTLSLRVPDAPQRAARKNGCDAALLEQISDSRTPDSLLCIRLVVPKEQVEGYVPTGRRNYSQGYSAFLDTAKPEPLRDNSPSKPQSPEPLK